MTSPAKYWCILQLKDRLLDDIIYEIIRHINWVKIVFKGYNPRWNQLAQICWLRGVKRMNYQIRIYNNHGWRIQSLGRRPTFDMNAEPPGCPDWVMRYYGGKQEIRSRKFSNYEFLKLIDKNINFMKIPFPKIWSVYHCRTHDSDACMCAFRSGDIEMVEYMMENHRHLVAEALFGNCWYSDDTIMTDYLIKLRRQFVFTGTKLRHIDDPPSDNDDECITFSDDSDSDSHYEDYWYI